MGKDTLVINIVNQFESIVSLYNEVEKTTDSYGTTILLHPSEIHMIAAIGNHPDSNLTGLANYLGITKGAATKMVQKLVKKGLVIKQFAPSSENEIKLKLTAIGKKAYLNHQSYRKNLTQKLMTIYREVPMEVLIQMKDIGKRTADVFNEILMQRKSRS
jgi:DNA-binding MarR family transcriptional regulator